MRYHCTKGYGEPNDRGNAIILGMVDDDLPVRFTHVQRKNLQVI